MNKVANELMKIARELESRDMKASSTYHVGMDWDSEMVEVVFHLELEHVYTLDRLISALKIMETDMKALTSKICRYKLSNKNKGLVYGSDDIDYDSEKNTLTMTVQFEDRLEDEEIKAIDKIAFAYGN